MSTLTAVPLIPVPALTRCDRALLAAAGRAALGAVAQAAA